MTRVTKSHVWWLSVLLLSVGIATNIVLFAVADAVMFRPFPFFEQHRLVIAAEHPPGWPRPRAEVSYRNFRDWRLRARTFQDLTAMGSSNWTKTLRSSEPIAVPYRAVTCNFFDVLGARPFIGRTFRTSDDERGAPPVVIISHGFWQRRFGADPSIVGRSITLDERPFTIVGVMPREFTYPAGADAWAPLVPELAGIHRPGLPDFLEERGAAVLTVVGRLKAGVDIKAASADLDRIVRELNAEFGGKDQFTSVVAPLVDDLLGSVRVRLWALLAAVCLLLAATIANVSGLMLVRMSARQREFAIRMALGASARDLSRQLLLESAALAAAATVCALIVARLALASVLVWLSPAIPRVDSAVIGLRVVGMTTIVAAITAGACWVIPLVAINRRHLESALRFGSHTVSLGFSRSGRGWLVATEVAIALVILAGAGLLQRSVSRLNRLDLGFDPRHLLAVEVGLPEGLRSGNSRDAVFEFYRRALAALATVPGVQSAAAVRGRPLKGPIGLDSSWQREGQSPDDSKKNPWLNVEPITPAYFATTGTRLVLGRVFEDADRLTTEPVVIVNEKLAKWAWPGESAIGKHVRAAALDVGRSPAPWWTVVGVVADIRYREIGSASLDVYVPFAQSWFGVSDIVVRAVGAPEAVASSVRERLRQVDRDGLINAIPMPQIVAAEEAPWHANFMLFSTFALVTVLLASAGIYAIVAASVTEQQRAIGVRIALGAGTSGIIRDVLRQAMRIVLPGIVVGLVAFAMVSHFIRTILFEVSPIDPPAVLAALMAVLALAGIACVLPVLHAIRIDPVVCLRAE